LITLLIQAFFITPEVKSCFLFLPFFKFKILFLSHIVFEVPFMSTVLKQSNVGKKEFEKLGIRIGVKKFKLWLIYGIGSDPDQ
jgi:hypothetical protein